MTVFGDHVVELQDGGRRSTRPTSWLRYGSCHKRKTNAQRVRRMAL